jgi:O-antigen/teichoic acid export membrane protein
LAYRSYFQGIESMEYPSVGVIAEKVFISIVAIMALLMGFHSITIALIMAGGALLDLIICMHFAHRFLPKLPRFNWHDSVNLLKKSLPYFLWSIFAVIYYRIDAVMLSLMTADKVVGWYGGAYRFFDVFMFFPSILTTVIFPIFSRLSISKVNQLASVLHKGFKYLLLFGVLIGIMVFFFSKQIVVIFLGLEGYTPSIIILKVFAFGVPLVYIDFILGNAIIAADKQRQWAFVGFIAIFINILLNYFLIHYTQFSLGNGGIGAAIATLITELYIMISSFILIPASYSNGIKINLIFKIVVTGGLTAGVIWVIQSTQVFWLINVILGGIIYGLSSIKLNVITQNELHKVHSFLSTNNLKSIVFQRNLN